MSSYAQAQPPTAPLPKAFVGAAIGMGGNDSGSRIASRIRPESGGGISLVWLIEGGVGLAERLGLGMEFVQTAAVTAATRGQSFNSSARQTEGMMVGLLRARVDVPFQLGRHVEVTWLTRFYALRRNENLGEPRAPVAWQLETKPSTRMIIGMSGRAVW